MLDWGPAQLRVLRTTRPKYAFRACNKVVQAGAPERSIAGGLAAPALLAHVLISKYCDHLPLYRQSQILRPSWRRSLPLDARGLGWRRMLVARGLARTPVQERVRLPTISLPMTRRSRYSILAADEPRRDGFGCTRASNGRGADPNLRPPSTCSHPTARPSDRSHILPPSRASCMWTDMPASSNWPTKRASRSQLVGATRDASSTMWPKPRRLPWQQKPCARSASSRPSRRASAAIRLPTGLPHAGPSPSPIVDALNVWLNAQLRLVSRRSTLAEALRYALSRWHGLTRFLNYGRVELDTNPVGARSLRSRSAARTTCSPAAMVADVAGRSSAC